MLPVDGRLRAAVDKALERAERRARDILVTHRTVLDSVAARLEAERYLDGGQLAELLREVADHVSSVPAATP